MNKSIKIGSLIVIMGALIVVSAFKPFDINVPVVPGIQFFSGSLDKAKAKAKKEKKLIFIDCYTTWCGPCKMMTKKTFTDKAVGEYFNKNFICLKMDMELTDGAKIRAEYNIDGYPTYLFMDASGVVKHREMGYYEPKEFLEVGKTALSN